jgi:hypothetical protein
MSRHGETAGHSVAHLPETQECDAHRLNRPTLALVFDEPPHVGGIIPKRD